MPLRQLVIQYRMTWNQFISLHFLLHNIFYTAENYETVVGAIRICLERKNHIICKFKTITLGKLLDR